MQQDRYASHFTVLCRCVVFTTASFGLVSASLAADSETLAMVEIPLDEPASGDTATEAPSEAGFPAWPERRRMQMQKRERIPPPPPGPYMSTALSGDTVRGLAFARPASSLDDSAGTKPPLITAPPIDVFSPDRPWPAMRMADRWKPSDGYHYVEPKQPAMDETRPPAQNPGGQGYPNNYYYGPDTRGGASSSGFNMGKRSYPAPAMTWTGPGSRSSVPSMDMYSVPRYRGYAYPQAGAPQYGRYPQFGTRPAPQADNMQRRPVLPPAAR